MLVLVSPNMTTLLTCRVHGGLAIEMPEDVDSYNGSYLTIFQVASRFAANSPNADSWTP